MWFDLPPHPHLSLHAHLPHSGAEMTETVTQGKQRYSQKVAAMGSVDRDLGLGNLDTDPLVQCTSSIFIPFQPLLGHGSWADAKEPSSGGGPWAQHPCLG